MKFIYFILNIIFFSKKVFKKPNENLFLIINGDQAQFIKKYLNESNHYVVYNRFTRGIERDSEINFYVLFFCIINFKFSIKDYVQFYIDISKPKAIITLIDNDESFYELNLNSNCKRILIQNTFRSTQGDIFSKIEYLKKKNYRCDYILVFNKHVGELYKKFLVGTPIQIGSFRSNSFLIKKTKKKYDILYVSSYKGQKDWDKFLDSKDITWGEIRQGEEKLLSFLKEFIKQNKDVRLHILGCKSTTKKRELIYFKTKLKGLEFSFIPRDKNRKTYQIIDEANILINTDSTLGYESLARGNKVCVFSTLPEKYPMNSSKFGWPAKIKDRGFFWTNIIEYKEFVRILNNTLLVSEDEYFKNVESDIIPNQIIYDHDNHKFQQIIKKI